MAYLEFVTSERAGEKILIEKNATTIGRGPDNVICVADGVMSTRHCCVIRNGSSYRLCDFDSTNGTYLNGERVKDAALQAGDTIRAGDTKLRIEGDDIENEPAPDAPTQPAIAAARVGGGATPSAFVTRRNTAHLWIGAIVVVVIVLAGLLFWLLTSLFPGN